MLKTVSSVVAALACVAMASPSHAQSFSPPSGTLAGSGQVTLTQATTVSCTINAPFYNVVTPTYISIPSHSLSPGSLLCGVWATTYGIWSATVVPGSTTQVDLLLGFNQTAPCYGTFRATWDNATHAATFTNVVLPGTSNCTVSGRITIPALTIL